MGNQWPLVSVVSVAIEYHETNAALALGPCLVYLQSRCLPLLSLDASPCWERHLRDWDVGQLLLVFLFTDVVLAPPAPGAWS